jgi:hypothetical protein
MGFEPPSTPVVALDEPIAAYCARAETGAEDALPADLMLLRTAINRLELDFSHHAARFSATYSEELHFNPGAISWMRENCRMTSSAAGTAVCVGEQVERLDKSAAAMRERRIGFAHLGLLVRPRECRYADALIELCAHRLDAGLIPQTASQRSHVPVTSTLETLIDLVGAPAGEMERAGVIAGATVRRLACDSTITRVLLDARSAVVDMGRSLRVAGSDAGGAELPRQGLPLARLRQAGLLDRRPPCHPLGPGRTNGPRQPGLSVIRPLSVPDEVALAGPGSRAEPS